MRAITIAGFQKPKVVFAGAAPTLRWLQVADLFVDSVCQRFSNHRRRKIQRIANDFRWSRFRPVLVAPVERGKFVIIDGECRTTAAALVGFENVPCQIVCAEQEQLPNAFNAVNSTVSAVSRMALRAATVDASESSAVRLAELCARADVELLRYPVAANRQLAGQTMAVAALERCLKRYGDATLITALQCVTQTTNNRPGALSARMIKALCEVLDRDRARRDSGLALLEEFDKIDLLALQSFAVADAAIKKIGAAEALAARIRSELDRVVLSGALVGERTTGTLPSFAEHPAAAAESTVRRSSLRRSGSVPNIRRGKKPGSSQMRAKQRADLKP